MDLIYFKTTEVHIKNLVRQGVNELCHILMVWTFLNHQLVSV